MSAARSQVLLAALCLAASGCCNILAELDPVESDGREEEPDQAAERFDLGDAAHPPGNAAEPVDHPWWLTGLEPSKYRLGYRLPEGGARALVDAYHGWARSVGHKRLDENRFQWRPPSGCTGGLQCVYATLDGQSVDGVEPIAALFRKRAAAAELDAGQLASLVVTFVQEIDYRIPSGEPFGVKPPALVVRDRWGDCDSKALLGHMILRSLGIGSVLISSEAHKHTMLGIALTTPGRSFTWSGRRYAFLETTAKRSPIGHIDPKLLHPNDWRVVPMPYDRAPKAASPGEPTPAPGPAPKRGAAEVIGGGRIRVH